jgi:hypothetical protein
MKTIKLFEQFINEAIVSEKIKSTMTLRNMVPVDRFFHHPSVGFIIGTDKARSKGIKTKVNITKIEPTQDEVDMNSIIEYSKEVIMELPLVVKYNNRYFAMNHRRIASQVLNGKKDIDVVLVNYSNGNFTKPIKESKNIKN